MLGSCDGCLVFYSNSTVRQMDVIIEAMKLDINVSKEEFTCRSLYLMGRRGHTLAEKNVKTPPQEQFAYFLFPVSCFLLSAKETMLKDTDLDRFKQQASCLGFSGEPNYQYDQNKGASLISRSVSQSVSQWLCELTLSFPPQSSAGTTRAFFM